MSNNFKLCPTYFLERKIFSRGGFAPLCCPCYGAVMFSLHLRFLTLWYTACFSTFLFAFDLRDLPHFLCLLVYLLCLFLYLYIIYSFVSLLWLCYSVWFLLLFTKNQTSVWSSGMSFVYRCRANNMPIELCISVFSCIY